MRHVTRNKILETAKKYIGYPSCRYNKDIKKHGSNEKGFTCSGFVRFVLKKSGVQIPPHVRHAREFFDFFGVNIHEDRARPGDLVFFLRHGIYISNVSLVSNHDGTQTRQHQKYKKKLKIKNRQK